MAFRTLALHFLNYLLFQTRVKGLPSPVRTVKQNPGLTAVHMYYQLNTKAEISQNNGPLFQGLTILSIDYAPLLQSASQQCIIWYQVRSFWLVKYERDRCWTNEKWVKMLMKERPRHSNDIWHMTSRSRTQCPASKSKTSLQITAVYLQSQSTSTQVRCTVSPSNRL